MKTITAVRTTLAAYPTEYAGGRAAQAALAPYACARDLLAALALSSPLAYEDRDAITLALIAEHQRVAHPLWQSILLVAYEPMLAGVWKRLNDKRDAKPASSSRCSKSSLRSRSRTRPPSSRSTCATQSSGSPSGQRRRRAWSPITSL